MIAGIAEDGVRAAGQRADDGQIGGETAAENEGRLGPFPVAPVCVRENAAAAV